MTLLAGFYALLHRYTGQTDVCVGTPIANRRQAELEPLIGLFINTLVLRVPLDGELTFRELLRRVKETALEGYAHQDLPFEMIVDALQPDARHEPLDPLPGHVHPAERGHEGAGIAPGLSLKVLEVDAGTSTFDLTLNMTEQTTGIATSVEYNTDIFDRATMRRLLGHLQTLLTAAAAQPDTPVGMLPLLSEEERRRMLVEWNETSGPVDDPRRRAARPSPVRGARRRRARRHRGGRAGACGRRACAAPHLRRVGPPRKPAGARAA